MEAKNLVDSEDGFIPELLDLLKNLRDLGAVVLSLTVFAYTAGWVSLWSYMSQFGATWLCAEIPISMILERGVWPVAFVSFFVWVIFSNVGENNAAGTDRKSVHIPFILRVFIEILLVFLFTFALYRHWHRTALALFFMLLAIFISTFHVVTLLRVRKKRFEWNLRSTEALIQVLIATLVLLPFGIGSFEGEMDLCPMSSLPAVKFTASNVPTPGIEPRLLLHIGDRFYVFFSPEEKAYPKIVAFSKEQISYVQQAGNR